MSRTTDTAATSPTATQSTLGALQVAVRSLRQHPGLAAAFLAATLLQGALQGAMIWALRAVLIKVGAEHGAARGILVAGAVTVFAVWLMRSASVFAAQMAAARLAHKVELEWMRRALEKLLTLSVRFFDKSSHGDLVMTAYNDVKTVRGVTLQFGQLVLYISQLAGLMIAAWLISPKLALIGLVSVPLGVIPVYWLGQQLTEAAGKERQQAVTLYDSYLQLSSGIRVIKVSGGESKVLEGVSGLGLIVVLIVGGEDVAAGRMAWQSLLGLLLAVMAVYSPAVGLLQLYGAIRVSIPNLDRLDAILHTVPEIVDRPGAGRLLEGPAAIELRNVSFNYGLAPALSGLSAVIYRGETIGIVGPTGSGKSTLISLLLRFYDPTSGAILFDGVDLRDVRHADLMNLSSIVLQEPFLFSDTIANNIRIGRPAATMDEVVSAAIAANVHDEIVQMESGFETVVGGGPEARGLSGGQRQRICVAAALLKNAPILFLDEATNSLDSVSEQKVQAAIDRLMQQRTTFVVAHRFSTLRNADRIIVLDHGQIVGLDGHDRLLATCETHRKLWASQTAFVDDLPRQAARQPEVVDA